MLFFKMNIEQEVLDQVPNTVVPGCKYWKEE
jgi:hypothetical protein